MAGLIKDNFEQEVLTELSWMMSAIEECCSMTGIETYRTTLLKYRVQPEEEHTLHSFLIHHWKNLDHLSINDIHQELSKEFYEHTKKPWGVSEEILEKLIQLWKKESGFIFDGDSKK